MKLMRTMLAVAALALATGNVKADNAGDFIISNDVATQVQAIADRLCDMFQVTEVEHGVWWARRLPAGPFFVQKARIRRMWFGTPTLQYVYFLVDVTTSNSYFLPEETYEQFAATGDRSLLPKLETVN